MCSSSVCLIPLCLLLCLRLYLGQPSEEVKVKPGGDVTLPCRSSGDAEVVLIKWIRPDLISDGYIFLYKDGQFHPDSQLPSYRGRVELKDPEKKDGDVSVVLKNVNTNDAGRYECRVGKNGGKPELISSFYLIVQDSETIRAEPGQSVSLPCRAPNNTDITVEWTRPGLEPEYVLMIRDKTPDTNNQHPSYQNRVELKDREMKDGDASIILKNVRRDDAGTYECRVFQGETSRSKRSAQYEPISIVHLQVHQSGDKEETGDKEGGDKERGDKEGGDKERGDKEGGDKEGGGKGLWIGLGVAAALLAVGVVGFIVYRKRRKPTEQRLPNVGYTAGKTDEAADP